MRVAILTTDNREHHRRYDVTEPYFGPAIEALLQGFAEIRGVEIHVICCSQRPMQSPGKLADNIWFHLLHVPKIGWLRTGYQGCIRAIRKRLRELRPDIVHGQGTERECALGAIFAGFPNVVTLHGNMRSVARAMNAGVGSYFWCAARLEQFALPRTLGVLCNSAYTESMVQPVARRTWHVPNAIRRAFFETPPVRRSTVSKPILLNIGVITRYKRQLELLEAAETLHRDGRKFELHFIGSADPRDNYAMAFFDRLRHLGQTNFAKYLGPKSLSDLLAAMDASLALVHVPSEEAFGLVVAEALSRNLKVFATNIGGISDIVAGIDGAELFEDFETLGFAIARWLRAGCPGQNTAAAKMRRRYHPDVIAKRHLEIYETVLADVS
jgi:glycosyltransferase involved in cell wall biosynthesis